MKTRANKIINLTQALKISIAAAQAAGALMRRNLHTVKRTKLVTQDDIKLELDVRSQKLIEKRLHSAFPTVAFLGEESVTGDMEADYRWVVDPIDGTVNYTYGIPHACVAIALQGRARTAKAADYEDGYQTLIGVVYDPFCDELWTAVRGQPARLNGKIINVSRRRNLNDSIICIGFAKTRECLDNMLPYFNEMVHHVRKVRMMGSAALALTYVASGRFDAYVERGIRLWDIAAGGLILECAGGKFSHEAIRGDYTYRMICSNGLVNRRLRVPW